jgi:hypothetical protein
VVPAYNNMLPPKSGFKTMMRFHCVCVCMSVYMCVCISVCESHVTTSVPIRSIRNGSVKHSIREPDQKQTYSIVC